MALVYYPADYSEAVPTGAFAALHEDKLETAPANVGAATNGFSFAGNGTQEMVLSAPANTPGSTGGTGATLFEVRLGISTTNMNVFCRAFVYRMSADLATILASAEIDTELSCGASPLSWTGTVNLGTWGSTDRLAVRYLFRNSSSMTQALDVYSDSVITGAGQTSHPGVKATWNEPVSPAINRTPASLAFSWQFDAVPAAPAPASQSVSLTNTGGGTLNWSATKTQAWLTLSPTSGTTTTETDTITVTVDPTGLAVGTYNDTITISDAAASNSPQTVAVTLTVGAMAFEQRAFRFRTDDTPALNAAFT